MAYIKAPEPEQQEMYDYLEELRQSADTNMFGAGVYLESEFYLGEEDAGAILLDWMKGHSDKTRILDGPGTGNKVKPGKLITRYEKAGE